MADCVCLLALDKAEAVPVDTHVWRIARQRYGAAVGGRSLTPRAYQQIGEGSAGPWRGTLRDGDGDPGASLARSLSLRR